MPAGHRFQIVAKIARKKGGYSDSRGVSCQFRVSKHCGGRDGHRRYQHTVKNRWTRTTDEPFAYPFSPGRRAPNKDRDISSERKAKFGQFRSFGMYTPEFIQRQQYRCGIGTSPAEPGRCRNTLLECDIDTSTDSGKRRKALRSPYRQVAHR